MLRRYLTVLLLGAVVPAVLAPPATAGTARAAACSPRGSKAVAANAQARVYTRPGRRDDNLFGCLLSVGRPVALGKELGADLQGIEVVQLAGRYVAVTVSDCGLNCGEAVNVYDLRSRRKTVDEPAVAAPQALDETDVTDLELSERGAVAWIGQTDEEDDPRLFRYVYAVDKGGKRRLDGGLDVAAESLALSGRFVYWSKGDTPFAAALR